jgi:hypothetical protein
LDAVLHLNVSDNMSSAKKRVKATAPERGLRSAPISVTAKTPLRLPPGTHVVFGRLVNGTGNCDGQVMACMEGVVVRDGSYRVDDPGYDTVQLRYSVADGGDDDEVWWEPTACVYEIIPPPPVELVRWEALTEDKGGDGSGDTYYYDHVSGISTRAKPDGFDEVAPPLLKAPPQPAATGAHTVLEAMSTTATTPSALICEGIRRGHFTPDAQAVFLHRVELAKDERGRLDADADKVPDQRRAVILSAPVQGILHYSVVPQGHEHAPLNIRHYLLRASVDRRPCNSGFYDLRCTSDASTRARRRPNGASTNSKPPVRCDLCSNLFAVVGAQIVDRALRGNAADAAHAAESPAAASAPPPYFKGRNDYLTARQQQEKMVYEAGDKKKLRDRVRYLNLKKQQLADRMLEITQESSVLDGSVEVSAAEYVLYRRRLRRRRCRRHCSSEGCCYSVYIYVCAFLFL